MCDSNIRIRSLVVALASVLTLCTLPGTAARQTDKPLVFLNVDVFDGSRLIRNTNVVVRDGMVH
ncbi:MAG TPA: hypothetical protein VF074_03415, partial [Pyrinomonadaceae bacterium]